MSARPGGGRLRLESWQNAQDQGTAAALSALGLGEAYRPTGAVWSEQYDAMVQIVGFPALAASEVLRPQADARALLSVALDAEGRAVAGVTVNAARELRQLRKWIAQGAVLDPALRRSRRRWPAPRSDDGDPEPGKEHAMELEHLLTKAACEETVLAFFHALDTRAVRSRRRADDRRRLLGTAGRLLSGREQILDALNGRAPDRATCHVVTNLRLATLDGSRATVAYFLTAYESRPTEQGGAPRLVAIRECQDTLVATAQGWRLQDKRSRRHLPPE